MSYLFNEFLYKPLLNLLFVIYDFVVSDLGIAIILMTLLIRFVLLPIFYKSAKDQTILQRIAPQIQEIQKKHKDNKEQQVQEIMAVYKEHKVNPFSSFGLLFIQLPILFAVYRVFLNGFGEDVMNLLYTWVPQPENIHNMFLGVINLSVPNIILVLIAVVLQYLNTRLIMHIQKQRKDKMKKGDLPGGDMAQKAQNISKKLIYVMPFITGIILWNLPSAVALYWLTTSLFSVIQQIVINKKIEKNEQHA